MTDLTPLTDYPQDSQYIDPAIIAQNTLIIQNNLSILKAAVDNVLELNGITSDGFCQWGGISATAPMYPVSGMSYYNSASANFYQYNGTNWMAIN